jgi:hypothetical protein
VPREFEIKHLPPVRFFSIEIEKNEPPIMRDCCRAQRASTFNARCAICRTELPNPTIEPNRAMRFGFLKIFRRKNV